MTDSVSRGRAPERIAMDLYAKQGADHGHNVTTLDAARDLRRLEGFDAAYLRLDTNVLGLAFAASRFAWELGLRIVDDPRSMLTCSNKAHVQGLLEAAGIPTPNTILLTADARDNLPARDLFAELGTPIVLKAPFGAFSNAVERAWTADELEDLLGRLGRRSDVTLLQSFVPSPFDWRVGIFNEKVLYVCKYHIPQGAWRIHDTPEGSTRKEWARVERVPVDDTPREVLATALQAAGCVGTGLYGVDLKQAPDGVCVMEINDNPTIDPGQEVAQDSNLFGRLIDEIATKGPCRA